MQAFEWPPLAPARTHPHTQRAAELFLDPLSPLPEDVVWPVVPFSVLCSP